MNDSEYIFDILRDTFDGRVYPLVASQETCRPYAVYTPVSTETYNCMVQEQVTDVQTMQLDIYTDEYTAALSLLETCNTLMFSCNHVKLSENISYNQTLRTFRVFVEYRLHR